MHTYTYMYICICIHIILSLGFSLKPHVPLSARELQRQNALLLAWIFPGDQLDDERLDPREDPRNNGLVQVGTGTVQLQEGEKWHGWKRSRAVKWCEFTELTKWFSRRVGDSDFWLMKGHGYSILDFLVEDALYLVQLRNIWGSKTWRGWEDEQTVNHVEPHWLLSSVHFECSGAWAEDSKESGRGTLNWPGKLGISAHLHSSQSETLEEWIRFPDVHRHVFRREHKSAGLCRQGMSLHVRGRQKASAI